MLIQDKKLILSDWMLVMYVSSIIVFDEGSTVLKIIRILFLGACLLKIILEKRIFLSSYIIWATAFTILCFLSVLWAASSENAISVSLTVLYNTICGCCVINFISNNLNRIMLIIKTIFFSAIFLWIKVSLQYGVFVFLTDRGRTDIISANSVGMVCAVAIVMGCFILFNGECRYRFPYFIGIAVNLISVILSASRKALIYIAIPIAVYCIFKSKKPGKVIQNIIISVLAVVLAYFLIIKIGFLYQIIGYRMESLINGILGIGSTDSSTSLRLDMIKWGMEWFRSKIWFGHGIDNYRMLLGGMGTSYGSSGVYAHNNYIELLVDLGISGIIVYYSLYVDILLTGIRKLFKFNPLQQVMSSLFIAIIVNEYGTVSYYSKFLQLLILLIWIVIKRYPKDSLPSESLSEERNRKILE